MSSFDVRKEIRERRLREAAEQKRDEPQPSAPPEAQIIRPLRPPSARSSGQDFGDAESYQIHSEPDEEWYQDETQEGKHEQVSEPKESDNPGGTRRLGRIGEGSPSASASDFLGESPKKVIPGKVQEPRAPKADAGGQLRSSSGQYTSAALERERERVTRLQQELAEEREAR